MENRVGPSQDSSVARAAAEAAGRVLTKLRATLPPADLGPEGDAQAQAAIAAVLRASRPRDAVLSEEATDDRSRLQAERVWIVDPLDGTREYGEPGRVDWAVHVALWERGRLTTGAVALPALGLVLTTDDPPAAPLPSPDPPRIAVSRTRPPSFVNGVADQLGADLIPMGSAGYKALSVVRGETDAYIHAGGQFEWDSAAPVAVATAAGLHCSRIDGSPLIYNRADPLLPDLIICRQDLAADLLTLISQAMASIGAEQ